MSGSQYSESDDPDVYASASATKDLATTIPVGGRLTFRNERFTFDYDGPPLGIRNWSDFHGCLLMVHVVESDQRQILGTAVLIGPGMPVVWIDGPEAVTRGTHAETSEPTTLYEPWS